MSSRRPSDQGHSSGPKSGDRELGLDLERDLPTTAEDVEVLRRLRNRPITPEQYADLLRVMGDASYEELARRPGPRGEPFDL